MQQSTRQVLQSIRALPAEERFLLLAELLADEQRPAADWIVVAGLPQERCLERYPCIHSWTFPVLRVLKGQGVPGEIRINGSYTDHANIPAPLRTASAGGNLLLFLATPIGGDSSVLAAAPLSEQAGA